MKTFKDVVFVCLLLMLGSFGGAVILYAALYVFGGNPSFKEDSGTVVTITAIASIILLGLYFGLDYILNVKKDRN